MGTTQEALLGDGTPRTQTDPALARDTGHQGGAMGPCQLQERQVALEIAGREEDCRRKGRALAVPAKEPHEG